MFSRILANQLACPSSFLSALAFGRLWNRRNAALNDAAFAALEPQPDDRILDVGFGGGYLLQRLAGVLTTGTLAGIDISPAIVARARRRLQPLVRAGRLELHCGAADTLPWPPAQFTKICSVNSAFYWADLAGPFAEFRRVLVPGGRIVICLTTRRSLEQKRFARHLQLYDAVDLQAEVASAGFRDLQIASAADRHRNFICLTATAAPTSFAPVDRR